MNFEAAFLFRPFWSCFLGLGKANVSGVPASFSPAVCCSVSFEGMSQG